MNKNRWFALMHAMGLPQSEKCFEALQNAYSEKSRHYHSVSHIEAMLRHLDSAQPMANHFHEVELAIWFHDAIYKPFSATNEADSAKWCKAFLTDHQLDQEAINRIDNLIMATLHNQELSKNDEMLMVDIDLTILGSPIEVYDEFEKNIRKEYSRVPLLIYRKKRKQLLETFLDRKCIYHLDYFRDKYESQARQNIARAIGSL